MHRFEDIDWSTLTEEQIDSFLEERVNAYEEAIDRRGGKRPKREGYIMERIASMETLREADLQAQKGKRTHRVYVRGKLVRVENRHIARHNRHAEEDGHLSGGHHLAPSRHRRREV